MVFVLTVIFVICVFGIVGAAVYFLDRSADRNDRV